MNKNNEVKPWKHLWLDTAKQLADIRMRMGPPDGRVRQLLIDYSKVVESLLYADVNGGLDEEYEKFPDAPQPDGEYQ